MDPPNATPHPTIHQWLDFIRQLSLVQQQEFASLNIPATLPLATAYIELLDDDYKTIAIRASILVYIASNKKIVPRQYQLEASNAMAHGLDSTVDSGTGSGKTLCQIILNLLFPKTTSITISPLKRLQILQAAEFTRWGIRTICINEDTPSDVELWNNIRDGYFQHLIVQPEQLKMFQGHLPRLARLLNTPKFVKTIACVHIDEAHTHHSAGLAHHGLPPFRPAWDPSTSSGYVYQRAAVVEHLNFNPKTFISLKLSSNRPNIVYATHRIVGSLKDFRNLDFLIAVPFTRLLKCIILHDDTQQSADAASYLDKRLPANLSNSGIVMHYHGGMSKDYLTQVFDDFSNPNGICKILNAAEGASTGLDVEDIVAVVDYGVSQIKGTALQRGGRCGRRGQHSVYLVMAEPWAYSASLDAAGTDSSDPDRPISGRLAKNAEKPARAGLAMILRQWRNLRETDRVHLNPPRGRKRKAKGLPNRKVAERALLQERLRRWLAAAHAADPLRAVRPASFILDGNAIKVLSTIHQDRMKTHEQAVAAVEETSEWASQWADLVLSVITEFDAEFHVAAPEPPEASTAVAPRAKAKENHVPGGDRDWVPPPKKTKTTPVLAQITTNLRRSTRLSGKRDNDKL
ncbi:hypothetical protein B0H17DRAFT_1175425 [Mycena rosella]|uniref:DNA 3'-5' helicase n=1 Tax=Mycena rosella TaxID=1033263 RepID=A0AAD7GTP1_MYCRO|nr:hypothetical protein B0H17DRAFT_1175425 [Mycena rosella]